MAQLAGDRIIELEQRIREDMRKREKDLVNPTMLFHFQPGQLVTRRRKTFSKLDPK